LSIDEIGKVREIKSQVDLILLEPLVRVLILYLLEVSVGVGQQVARDLSESAYLPVAKG